MAERKDTSASDKGSVFKELKVPGGVIKSMDRRVLTGAMSAANNVIVQIVKPKTGT